MSALTNRLRASLSHWANPADPESEELRGDSVREGLVSIRDAVDREQVTVQGVLRTVTLRPRGGVPALEAELDDGSGTLTVLWLGRRRIAGIAPGRRIRIEGRVGRHDGDRVIYNPRYELKA